MNSEMAYSVNEKLEFVLLLKISCDLQHVATILPFF